MLATRPTLTGSSPVVNTIGTVVVAALAARPEMVPPVAANTLTPRPMSSAMIAGNGQILSNSSANWESIFRLESLCSALD
jgi:hypothetical protein